MQGINSETSYPAIDNGLNNNSAGFIQPYKIASGSTRGTQIVGFGDVKIDGANNQITIGKVTKIGGQQEETVLGKLGNQSFGLKVIDAKGGQLLIGVLPDGNLGIQLLDPSGNEVMRAGFLPITQIYGWATATPGNTLDGQV